MNKIELLELENFTGTSAYYRYMGGLVITDGVKFLAEKAGCFWFLDVIASHQPNIKGAGFQIWGIKKYDDNTAEVYCKEDSDLPDIVSQDIHWTDFPFKEFELYCIDDVILLKSEY